MSSSVFLARLAPSPDEIAAVDVEVLAFTTAFVRTGVLPTTGVLDSPVAYEYCGALAGTSTFSTFPSRPAAIRAAVALCAAGYAQEAAQLVAATLEMHVAGLYTVLAGDARAMSRAGLTCDALTDVLAESVSSPGRSILQAVRAARRTVTDLDCGDMSRFVSEHPDDLFSDIFATVSFKSHLAARPGAFAVFEVLVRDADQITTGKLELFREAALTF